MGRSASSNLQQEFQIVGKAALKPFGHLLAAGPGMSQKP